MDPRAFGILLLLVAGAMNGSFILPMKFTKKWAWENIWLVWTVFALAIFPIGLTLLTVPSLGNVYRAAGAAVLIPAAFGAGWGISQVFLGLAVDGIGMALSFSVILGLSAAVGSLIPLIHLHPEAVFTRGGMTVLGGVLLVLLGVSIAAVAGRRRELALAKANNSAPSEKKVSIGKGLFFATISGLGSALTNLGFVFGDAVTKSAQRFGADPAWATTATWMPLMIAGGIPNLIYCIYLMKKNATGGKFSTSGTTHYYGLAALMAFFWYGSTIMYGVAATKLGDWGPVLGWPLFMSLIVIVANAWGVSTGEWKTARQPLRIMGAGVATLVIAIFVLGYSSRLF
jgi:L-rhamnose-H+ transport protein